MRVLGHALCEVGDPLSVLDVKRMHERYAGEAEPMPLWEARIAARDFSGAEQLLADLRANGSEIGVYMSEQEIASIIIAWLLGDDATLAELLPAKRAFLEQSRGDDGEFINYGTNIEVALIAAAEGKTEEAERRVRLVLREARKDKTDQMAMLANACQVLGMAGAATAAVDCLRTAFSVPSTAHPFLEPYLPYYDPIRDDPVFEALLAEIE